MSGPQPFFFEGEDGTQLFGVWRAPVAPDAVWVVAPPFAEEEKSARRHLTMLCEAWQAAGQASLLLTLRGTGDSAGNFADATLEAWRSDIRAACRQARQLAPGVPLKLAGIRLGASLALLEAQDADELVLIEPILSGRSFLSQLLTRQKLRASLTERDAASANHQSSIEDRQSQDLDGWPLSDALRDELNAMDVSKPPAFAGRVRVVQVGPREAIAPRLEAFARALDVTPRAVVMQPFWNLLDYADSKPFIKAVVEPPTAPNRNGTSAASPPEAESGERTVWFDNEAGQRLVGVWHHASETDKPIIVMLHGWSGYRAGPHQMLTRAARAFASDGFSVLRFDFAGRGDSQGDTPSATLATMQADTRAALRWCCEQQGVKRFVLLGLCSGCEVALSCAGEANIESLALWSAPILAAGESSERRAGRRAHHLKLYARKLLNPATYGKILTGRLDMKGVGQAVSGGGGEARNEETGETGHLPHGWRERALRDYEKARRPLLLIYGTSDPTTEEALAWHRAHARAEVSEHLVEGANHSFYGLGWEREVIETTRVWLRGR